MAKEELVWANTKVPVSMDVTLRRIAAEKKVSRSEVVRIAIDEYISKYEVVGVERLPGPEDADCPVLVIIQEKKRE